MLTQTQQALFDSIVHRAEQLTGIEKEKFLSKIQKAEYVKCRTAIVMALIHCKWYLKDIARALGYRDHSSMIHLRENYNNLVSECNRIGTKDPFIEVVQVLSDYAEMRPENPSITARVYRTKKCKIMTEKGYSLLSIVGVAA